MPLLRQCHRPHSVTVSESDCHSVTSVTDPTEAIIDLDGAQQIPQVIVFIAFPEFLRSSRTFFLHKVLTRPNIFDYVVDSDCSADNFARGVMSQPVCKTSQ